MAAAVSQVEMSRYCMVSLYDDLYEQNGQQSGRSRISSSGRQEPQVVSANVLPTTVGSERKPANEPGRY